MKLGTETANMNRQESITFKQWVNEIKNNSKYEERITLINFAREIVFDNFADRDTYTNWLSRFSNFLINNKSRINEGFILLIEFNNLNNEGGCYGKQIRYLKSNNLIKTESTSTILKEIHAPQISYYKNNHEDRKRSKATLNKIKLEANRRKITLYYRPKPPHIQNINYSLQENNESKEFGKFVSDFKAMNTKFSIEPQINPWALINTLGLYYLDKGDYIASVILEPSSGIILKKPLLADSYFVPYFCPSESQEEWGFTRTLEDYKLSLPEAFLCIQIRLINDKLIKITDIISIEREYDGRFVGLSELEWENRYNNIKVETEGASSNFLRDYNEWQK